MELVSSNSAPAMARLGPENTASLPAQVRAPAYDRRQLQAGIVHLGIGAFARAHLAAVNEETIEQTGDLRFGIVGVSMRSSATSDALAPQSGLYTLALRDADGEGKLRQSLRLIGNLIGLRVAPHDAAGVPLLIASPQTRIVSLTITEKGYCHDPATGSLLMDHTDIAHDLANPATPRSAVGAIVRGLQRRHEGALGPLTLMSLDNLPSNGDLLRSLVLAFARQCNPVLADWIEDKCTFPNSMVDRIVPKTSASDQQAISREIGLEDKWPVVAEPFLQWAVEDRFACGRPRWDVAGARLVESAKPFERLKLRMVNATHSALAYLSVIAGLPTVDAAMRAAPMQAYLRLMVESEIIPELGSIPGVDLQAFAGEMAGRFANPALAHQTQQIAMDGSQKLPQRILGTVADRLERRAPFPLLAMALAGWIRYLEGVDESGSSYRINDPLSAALAQQVERASALALAASSPLAAEQARITSLASFNPVFGVLGKSKEFINAVAMQSLALRRDGVLGALTAQVRSSREG